MQIEHRIRPITEENIKLTITMLVSNRINTIRKCMDSIKPILDQVPSELIAVDTGSMDGSIDVVKEYTDKIVKFTWCNDFSKARGVGLEKASGEWVMYLDDDEWFEDVSEIILFFNSDEYLQYNRAVYIVRSYGDKAGRTYSESNAARMVKRTSETCFTGKVHEFIGPQKGPTKYFDAFVHHYGYAFESEDECRRHSLRNLPLVMEELAREPDSLRLLTQAVQEYFSLGEMHKVLELCRHAAEVYKKDKTYRSYAGYCYNFSLRAYVRMQDWENGYVWGKEILAKGAPNPLALMGTIRDMIRVCLNAKKYEDGLSCLEKYLELYRILKIENQVNREDICLDLSMYLQEKNHDQAYMDGIELACRAGEWKKAEEYILRKNWNEKPLVLYETTLDYVMELWTKCNFRQEFLSIWDKVISKPAFHEQITRNMEKYEQDNPEGYRKLLYLFASCPDTSVYTDRYRFYYFTEYGSESDRQKMTELLTRLWQDDANPLLWDNRMWSAICKNNLSVTMAVKKTGFTIWFMQVRSWLESNVRKNGEMNKIFHAVYNGEESGEMHFRFLKLKYEEGILRRNLWERGAERMDPQWLLDCLDAFYSKAWEFYSLIYREEMFGYDIATILPPEAAFAVYIRLAIQSRQEGDNAGYLRILPKAAECYPPMKEWCKVLLQKEKESQPGGRTRAEETEFVMLASHLKQKARELADTGNYEAAKQLILQLEKLIPGDRELEALTEKILPFMI